MRKKFSISVFRFFILVVALSCVTSETETDYVSGIVPDQIVLNFSAEPSNSIAISWRASNSVTTGFIKLKKKDSDNEDFIDAHYEAIDSNDYLYISNNPVIHRFSVILEDLDSNSKYSYSVCSEQVRQGVHCSDQYDFKTAPDDDQTEFSFMYMGDVQRSFEEWSNNFNRIISNNPKVRFTLLAGDFVNESKDRSQYDQLFSKATNAFATTAFMPAMGNHDVERSGEKLYKAIYTLPENGTKKKEEDYWFRYGSALFLVLNSNRGILGFGLRDQAEWIKNVIEENPTPWIILSFHHPIWSSDPDRDNKKLREAFMPVLEEYGVDLVLNGHDHSYMRTHPLIDGEIVGSGEGPIYVVSTSSNKYYKQKNQEITARGFTDIKTYQIINISESVLQYKAISFDNELMDSFSISK